MSLPKVRATPPPDPALLPLVGRDWIYRVAFGALIGLGRIDAALQSPGAPRPVIGGRGKGVKVLYNREEILAWVKKISRPGCWPVREKEAA